MLISVTKFGSFRRGIPQFDSTTYTINGALKIGTIPFTVETSEAHLEILAGLEKLENVELRVEEVVKIIPHQDGDIKDVSYRYISHRSF